MLEKNMCVHYNKIYTLNIKIGMFGIFKKNKYEIFLKTIGGGFSGLRHSAYSN